MRVLICSSTRILNLDSRWRCVVSFTLRPLYPGERDPGTHCIGCWVGPRVGLDVVAKIKNPCPCPESNSGHLACSLFTILTELPQLCDAHITQRKLSYIYKIRLGLNTQIYICGGGGVLHNITLTLRNRIMEFVSMNISQLFRVDFL
jgi:hypothetical protein